MLEVWKKTKTVFVFKSISSNYLLLTLYFYAADETEPLPDLWAYSYWYVLRSVEILHGLQHFAQSIGSLRTAQALLFEQDGAAVRLGPHFLNPETQKAACSDSAANLQRGR